MCTTQITYKKALYFFGSNLDPFKYISTQMTIEEDIKDLLNRIYTAVSWNAACNMI